MLADDMLEPPPGIRWVEVDLRYGMAAVAQQLGNQATGAAGLGR